LLIIAVALGGCGYASSPGMVVEAKEYPLNDKATLIVTRHLDDWRTGSAFTFEWYVVTCRGNYGSQVTLMKDMVLRGTYSSEIPQERIHMPDGKFGYAFFNEVVVFDKNCNMISHFDPWRTYIIGYSYGKMNTDYRIGSVEIEKSGQGLINLSWRLKEGGVGGLKFQTKDFGVHWMLTGSDVDVREEIRVESANENADAAAAASANFQEITSRLENSEYVVEKGKVTRRAQSAANRSTTLSPNEEFKILQKCFDVARVKGVGRDGDRMLIVDNDEHYKIIIGNPAKSRALEPHYAYDAKVLVNKKAPILAQWLSDD
jgi:hypothetical protein